MGKRKGLQRKRENRDSRRELGDKKVFLRRMSLLKGEKKGEKLGLKVRKRFSEVPKNGVYKRVMKSS